MYPDRYDLVLLPIGFVDEILEQAAAFAGLLDAKRVVPMHYWNPDDRDRFVQLLDGTSDARGHPYAVRATGGPELMLGATEGWEDGVEVIALSPAPAVDAPRAWASPAR
jgi:L-ascorbate metabolism protein UlaG (beta-lactamase superfamily)